MRSQTSCHFYPRPPRGGRRQSSFLGCSRFLFLSTPSARRATGSGIAGSTDRRISIHALREEGDHPYSSWERGSNEFLSTPSARRATIPRPHLLCWHHDFYPRPPRGGRRSAAGLEGQAGRFLSTPSARRATPMSRSICARRSKFLSTPSARRATLYNHRHAHCCQISIHALREEGDRVRFLRSSQRHNFYPRPPRGGRPVRFLLLHVQQDFYPRPPRGGRPATALHRGKAAVFLSTPSARRATPTGFCLLAPCRISIHALREEGDLGELHKQLLQLNFYPRPPRGGRHAHISIPAPFAQFLSTPSARRATAAGCFDGTDKTYFYPRPPRGGRHTSVPSLSQAWIFLSTPSARRATVHTQQPLWEREISIHALREEGDFVVYC